MFSTSRLTALTAGQVVRASARCTKLHQSSGTVVQRWLTTTAPPTNTNKSTDPSPAPVSFTRLVYEGRYWKALRRIRRVSLASCLTGLIVVPIGLIEHSDTLSQTGQMAIMGVTILTTVGSTLGLHYLSHTYVSKMYAPAAPPADSKTAPVFEVERLTLLGNSTGREKVSLSRISKTTAFDHPFSNFVIAESSSNGSNASASASGGRKKGQFYYVSTPAIQDEQVKQQFDTALGV